MHKSFEPLLVADEAQLRDPARLRRLWRGTSLGLKIAGVAFAVFGVAMAAAAVWAVYAMLFEPAGLPAGAFLPTLAAGVLLSVIFFACALLIRRELGLNPLRACLEDPASCDFAQGLITSADYLSSGSRASARTLVKGNFGEGGLFIEEFDPSVWADAVAERGEARGLKPGDDRYPQKGKRARLPIPAWVVFRRSAPRLGALAGIPAGALTRKAE